MIDSFDDVSRDDSHWEALKGLVSNFDGRVSHGLTPTFKWVKETGYNTSALELGSVSALFDAKSDHYVVRFDQRPDTLPEDNAPASETWNLLLKSVGSKSLWYLDKSEGTKGLVLPAPLLSEAIVERLVQHHLDFEQTASLECHRE